MSDNFIKQAKEWAEQDPDKETQTELLALIDNGDTKELARRFSGRLKFGTAGLRGPLQAGPMGMNRVSVAQTAAGLAKFLLEHRQNHTIVIGYDGRKNSQVFAKDTAKIMQAAGISAYIMPDLRPTPVLAFMVRKLNAGAGVMVTASHNPPQDNGYKVYLGNEGLGAQIVAPHDYKISQEISWVAANIKVNNIPRSDNYSVVNKSLIDDYIRETSSFCQSRANNIKYVYTAMHGVGTETLLSVLSQAGLTKPILVAEQCDPDGNFPTVNFPNPEEEGALDLAIAKAKEHDAEFIIANDPDGDRLAVAVPDESGNWKMLHGNELGLYLAWYCAQRAQSEGKKGTLACSLVSSPALAKIAKSCGMQHKETLTGFKWIARVPNLLFGYEEALGYLLDPNKVGDKDGISAAVGFLDLINHLKNNGQTFTDYRLLFRKTFGTFYSDQLSIRVDDLGIIDYILKKVRENPFYDIAGIKVNQHTDFLQTDEKENILIFNLVGEHRVILRPSGTEPKLKIYLDTKASTLAEARRICGRIKNSLDNYLNVVTSQLT